MRVLPWYEIERRIDLVARALADRELVGARQLDRRLVGLGAARDEVEPVAVAGSVARPGARAYSSITSLVNWVPWT